MRNVLSTLLFIFVFQANIANAYDAVFFFALQPDLVDFHSVQPGSSQSVRVGRHAFIPFTSTAGRFISANTRAGLLETMEPVALSFGRMNAKRYISFGLTGVLTDKYLPGDIVIVRHVARHDRGAWREPNEFHPRSTDATVVESDSFLDTLAEKFMAQCQTAGLTVHDQGRLVSGDAFITSNERRTFLAQTFDVDLVDMNSAAFMEAAVSFGRPGLIIRVISDRADDSAGSTFDAFVNNRNEVLRPAARALAHALREMSREQK
ncbi:MAG TPA: 5'-methylthioadenosine/S-adenosylhomocysteine nucleosidase [Kiritimatiellia bacterium]|nr:5'-methylthioadenosine/S-adenosylhomocysteine nucleosidase [Kiritimatiellia bacterium]